MNEKKNKLVEWEDFAKQFKENNSNKNIKENEKEEKNKFECEEILSSLYHDWPICMKCGYPANTEEYFESFCYYKTKYMKQLRYECPQCEHTSQFHPKWMHEGWDKHYCSLPIRIGNLEKEYIDWACNPNTFKGVHIITWPDSYVRFSPVLSYVLFISSFKKFKKEPKRIIHISPKSPNISEDIIAEYEDNKILTSLDLSPSISLGYLHICQPDITNISQCPINKSFSVSQLRSGIPQYKGLIGFVTDFINWPSQRIFYIITNERFQLTGFTVEGIVRKISSDISYDNIIIIIDNICVYLRQNRIEGLVSFLQSCIKKKVPVIAFAPRSALRYQLNDLISMITFQEGDLFTHTIDTKERISYLLKNNYFLNLYEKHRASPYSTYGEVAYIWE